MASELVNNATQIVDPDDVTVPDSFWLKSSAELGAATGQYHCRPAAGETASEARARVQAFFDYITANDVGTAHISGDYDVDGQLIFGPASGSTATKTIVGSPIFTASAAFTDTMLLIRGFDYSQWIGRPKFVGVGGTTYSTRGNTRAVDIIRCGRTRFDGFSLTHFLEDGVRIDGTADNSSLCDVGVIRAVGCGSGPGVTGLSATWSNEVQSGGTGSALQRSQIDVTALPDASIDESTVLVEIDGALHYVYSIDRVNDRLSIFPWIPSTATPGSLKYIYGAALHLDGGDASVIGYSAIDAVNGGFGLLSASLYGPEGARVVAQACSVGLGIGRTPTSTHSGCKIGALYSELNTFDVGKITALNAGTEIGIAYATSLGKMAHCGIARLSSDAYNITEAAPPMLGLSIVSEGTKYESRALMRPGQLTNSSTSMPIGGPPLNRDYHTAGDLVVNLSWNDDEHYISGYSYDTLKIFGTGSGAAPAGEITFAASGSTVNGGASGVFSGLTKPANFLVMYDISRDVFEVVNTTP